MLFAGSLVWVYLLVQSGKTNEYLVFLLVFRINVCVVFNLNRLMSQIKMQSAKVLEAEKKKYFFFTICKSKAYNKTVKNFVLIIKLRIYLTKRK